MIMKNSKVVLLLFLSLFVVGTSNRLHCMKRKFKCTKKEKDKPFKKRRLNPKKNPNQKQPDKQKQEICWICTKELGNTDLSMIKSCRHTFHEKCLQNWLMNHATCPRCETIRSGLVCNERQQAPEQIPQTQQQDTLTNHFLRMVRERAIRDEMNEMMPIVRLMSSLLHPHRIFDMRVEFFSPAIDNRVENILRSLLIEEDTNRASNNQRQARKNNNFKKK